MMQMNLPGHDSPRRASITRTALALVLLVMVVGGVAYVSQNLRRWKQSPVEGPAPVTGRQKPLVEFTNTMTNGSETRIIALWEKPRARSGESTKGNKDEKDEPAGYFFKEFESGSRGHYDFLFRNVSGRDLEVGLYTSSCDCASVQLCTLPAEEWERLRKSQKESPGDELKFDSDPAWHDLSSDAKVKPTPVKEGGHGIIRARWQSRKSPGQELNLSPVIWVQAAGQQADRQYYPFGIPGMVTRAVRVHPQRVNVGTLPAGTTAKAEFDLWSSTRETLDLKLGGPTSDPLFSVALKPLSEKERAELAGTINANKEIARDQKGPTRVLSAYHVTVTVHESRAGRQLEQGVFFRKLPIILDGFANPDLPGPEVVGRVETNIEIGGADDAGKIRFKSFDSDRGAIKEVELAAGPKVVLEPHSQHPPTLKVELKRDAKTSSAEASRWKLKVTVPPNTFAGSFTELDAVVLRVVGPPERLVRIPIEGNVAGR